jgi:hypothetical protein
MAFRIAENFLSYTETFLIMTLSFARTLDESLAATSLLQCCHYSE